MALIQDYNELLKYDSNLTNPTIDIKKIIVNGNVVWQKVGVSGPDYTIPFTIEMIESGSITISNPQGYTIKYQINNGSAVSSSSTAITLNSLSANDTIKLYGNNASYGTSSQSTSTKITSTAKHNIYGNIMSLISETNFSTLTSFTTTYSFAYFFYQNTGLVNAKDLILRPTTLEYTGPYNNMFYGCTNLLTPPELPATTISGSCYASCFRGCNSLTYAPALPAETVGNSSYSRMFYGCSSLTEAPALPATTLNTSCYQYMFYGCSNITTAPDLLAADLYTTCYRQMFYGCSKLNYVKCLAETNISTSSSVSSWLYNVASTGKFVKKSGISWSTGASGIPSGWTVEEV